MALIRFVLRGIILFLDKVFAPRPLERAPEQQVQVDQAARALSLYQFEACPFCVKVRRAMKRLNLPIELRDAKKAPRYAEELVAGGGKLQVPCLRIEENGSVRWLYESGDIIDYLERRFASDHAA